MTINLNPTKIKINNEDFPKCPKCGERKFVYHKKILGIKKEGSIPSAERKTCIKCGGGIKTQWIGKDEITNYPSGYLTLYTCYECGYKRIEDGTVF